jgi:hypothetical protein
MWLGLGFTKNMTNTDMVIAQIINGNQLTLGDYYSYKHGKPSLNAPPGPQGLQLLGYSVNYTKS